VGGDSRSGRHRTVVVGYDGSPGGEDALVLGRVLSGALAARPLVVTVVLYPDHLISDEERELVASECAAETLEAGAGRLRELDPRTLAVADDSPARALDRIADADHPLLIVLGSAHRGPVGRVFLGSVGQSLLSGAPCAIAVAPGDYAHTGGQPLRRIGVAINGSEESWAAFATAKALVERLEGELVAIAVAAPPRYGYGAALAALGAAEYESAEHKAAIAVLEEARGRVPSESGFEAILRQGLPERELAAAGGDVDLLVIGSRGYGPVRRTLLGGVSSKLMHQARCPVLVLPRRAGSDPLGLSIAEPSS
jgi:nucleotide-binding universal stress UspA family protein